MLSSVHASRPVNPVLANPVYLTGYIEQMGTGTTDIIERCEKAGLRTPEFYQDEDFRAILWRPESADEQDSVRFSISSNSSDPTDGSQETPQKTPQKSATLSHEFDLKFIKYFHIQKYMDFFYSNCIFGPPIGTHRITVQLCCKLQIIAPKHSNMQA